MSAAWSPPVKSNNTHSDEQTLALEPGTAAAEEADDEDEDAKSDAHAVDREGSIGWQQSRVAKIGEVQPQSQAQHAASNQLCAPVKNSQPAIGWNTDHTNMFKTKYRRFR